MKRVDGTLPSTLRLAVCNDDPRVLQAMMATEAGVRAVDEAAGLRKLPSEMRLAACGGDYRVLQAMMATEAGVQVIDKAAGLV